MNAVLAAAVCLLIFGLSMAYFLSVKDEDTADTLTTTDKPAEPGPLSEPVERLSTDLEPVKRPARAWAFARASVKVVVRVALGRPSDDDKTRRDDVPPGRSRVGAPGSARPPFAHDTDPDVTVEVVPNRPTSDQIELERVHVDPANQAPAEVVETVEAEVIEPPELDRELISLEGVDMSNLPTTGNGGGDRLPTVGALRVAMATGGFALLRGWLKAFRRANESAVGEAMDLHHQTMALARKKRAHYVQALRAFDAVNQDGLDPGTINSFLNILIQAHLAADGAAKLTRQTAVFVVEAGGAPPTVAAAIGALDRNHGGMAAAAVASPVRPVRDTTWYLQ